MKMIKIKSITTNPKEGSATVVCENSVSLNEEDRIRKILERFYTRRPDLVRLAVEVAGTMILFHARPNCKRLHTKEDIEAVLKATDCYPVDEKPKRSATKKGVAIRRYSLQAAQAALV